MKKELELIEIVDNMFINEDMINVYKDKDNPLFKASEIIVLLDYSSKNCSQALKFIDESNKFICLSETNGGIQSSIFVNLEGLKQWLSISRKRKSKIFLSIIDSNFYFKPTPKQTEFEEMLSKAIKYHLESEVDFDQCVGIGREFVYKDNLNFETEYTILNYKVDIYFKNLGLIVEYDENNHKYHREEDSMREYKIKDYLNKELGYDSWETDGSVITFIHVNEGEEFKGIIEIITHLMANFI